MLQRLARRAIEALVALFALLGFCFVPLGERTALEHVGAIARTKAASEAAGEVVEAARRVRRRLFAEVDAPPAPAPALVHAAHADAGAPGAADASVPWRSGYAVNDERLARSGRR